jgi:hypothetical protein
MAINLAGANTYFGSGSHVYAAVWSGFSTSMCTAAIAMAKQKYSRALRRELNENEPAYQPGDFIREDRAVYEQALGMLIDSQIADATGATPQPQITGRMQVDNTGPFMSSTFGFYDAALEWLNFSGACVVRG